MTEENSNVLEAETGLPRSFGDVYHEAWSAAMDLYRLAIGGHFQNVSQVANKIARTAEKEGIGVADVVTRIRKQHKGMFRQPEINV